MFARSLQGLNLFKCAPLFRLFAMQNVAIRINVIDFHTETDCHHPLQRLLDLTHLHPTHQSLRFVGWISVSVLCGSGSERTFLFIYLFIFAFTLRKSRQNPSFCFIRDYFGKDPAVVWGYNETTTTDIDQSPRPLPPGNIYRLPSIWQRTWVEANRNKFTLADK